MSLRACPNCTRPINASWYVNGRFREPYVCPQCHTHLKWTRWRVVYFWIQAAIILGLFWPIGNWINNHLVAFLGLYVAFHFISLLMPARIMVAMDKKSGH